MKYKGWKYVITDHSGDSWGYCRYPNILNFPSTTSGKGCWIYLVAEKQKTVVREQRRFIYPRCIPGGRRLALLPVGPLPYKVSHPDYQLGKTHSTSHNTPKLSLKPSAFPCKIPVGFLMVFGRAQLHSFRLPRRMIDGEYAMSGSEALMICVLVVTDTV